MSQSYLESQPEILMQLMSQPAIQIQLMSQRSQWSHPEIEIRLAHPKGTELFDLYECQELYEALARDRVVGHME